MTKGAEEEVRSGREGGEAGMWCFKQRKRLTQNHGGEGIRAETEKCGELKGLGERLMVFIWKGRPSVGD